MTDFIENICYTCVHYPVCHFADDETSLCNHYIDHHEIIKHGRWESYISRLGMYVYHRCSVCGESNPYEHTNRAFSNYCPNCGAKMDLED